MTQAEKLGFEINTGPVTVSDREEHIDFKSLRDIHDGYEVFLRYQDNCIRIKDTKRNADSLYSGSIGGFGCGGVSFKELKMGEELTFLDTHVFRIARL